MRGQLPDADAFERPRAHAGDGKGDLQALDSADIGSLDDNEASKLIGRVFTINTKTVKLGRANDCLPAGFEAQLVETTGYVRKWAHASAENLGLSNPVTVVDLGCTSAFIKNRQHIVVFW